MPIKLVFALLGLTLQKYDPKTVVQQEHILLLNLKNFEQAQSTHEFLLVFVYGEECPKSQKSLGAFRTFSRHLYFQKSKIKPAILHADTPKKYQKYFTFRYNPTLLFYHRKELIFQKAWSSDDVADTQSLIFYGMMIKQERKFMEVLDSEGEFNLGKLSHPLSLVFVGDQQKTVEHKVFLEIIFTKKSKKMHYFRILNSTTMEKNKLYLYRKKDDSM